MKDVFFIVGFSRSGTTAMARILDTAANARVFVEQPPKMCIAARMKYEGILPYPEEFILKSKQEKIREVHSQKMIYGDKNQNYLYFIHEMRDIWKCKFIFLVRDGREVVRSALNWEMKHQGGNYNRYEDHSESTITQPEENFWDFGRLRPLKGSKIHGKWKTMELFEKFAWSWNEYNKILFDKIHQLDSEDYMLIDMNHVTADHILELFQFLNLETFNESKVTALLGSKINTTPLNESEIFPHWSDWDSNLMGKFKLYASEMMERMGYV